MSQSHLSSDLLFFGAFIYKEARSTQWVRFYILGGKKTILLYGVLGMYVGYTTMILASLLVYFGVRSYRDNVNGGTVSFGRALLVGLLISLVATVMYVATWELSKDRIAPNYIEKYQAHMIEKAKARRRDAAAAV